MVDRLKSKALQQPASIPSPQKKRLSLCIPCLERCEAGWGLRGGRLTSLHAAPRWVMKLSSGFALERAVALLNCRVSRSAIVAVHILPGGLTPDLDRYPVVLDSSSGAGASTIDREWSLLECGQTLYRHRLPLLCVAGLGIVAAALATLLQPPMYQSHASIQIQGLNDN